MDDEMLKIIETTVPFAVPATLMLMLYVIFSNWSNVRAKKYSFPRGVINSIKSGIDDDFLMIAAWRELDRKLPVHQRIALVMGDAGASITVTSFTNFFCFALGYFMCSTPAVADFCMITAWAVVIDYYMQVPHPIHL
uniref:SSD domain-containing protein n=1 Tax=Heterorhabditis bacteriophora TaxID=37862 RepID=A0A1I7X6H3_HETBA